MKLQTEAQYHQELSQLWAMNRNLKEDNERLQRIIDSRPAINAGLPESYIEWSQKIYLLEASRVLSTTQ